MSSNIQWIATHRLSVGDLLQYLTWCELMFTFIWPKFCWDKVNCQLGWLFFWVCPKHKYLFWYMKITQLHVGNLFISSNASDLCVPFPISGKIEVEHVISKKLQLKRKAEVSISVIMVKKIYMLSLFQHSSRGNPIEAILSFLLWINYFVILLFITYLVRYNYIIYVCLWNKVNNNTAHEAFRNARTLAL